ncbi:MupA/Atu3671 family FMN-dependent luciferase-like monooxygenase [Endothiovibrio diazotrophicus]
MKFGILFFSSEASSEDAPDTNKYQLLVDAAKYVDQQGFDCICTPERHFDTFGGLFPNPSVTSAALAMITERIQIRSGSLISPLHHPVRIVEEWSVVDNLSGGRVALAFGSGWNVNDFIFSPDRYATRNAEMYRQIELIRHLWSGGSTTQINGRGQEVEIRPQPRPVQKELEIWTTSSGNIDTFVSAGKIGTNLLTHMEHQDDEALREKILRYRQTRQEHGFDPDAGKITLMLHTFLGRDMHYVKQKVRDPLRDYLRAAIDLELKAVAGGGTASGGYKVKTHEIAEQDTEELLDILFERYFYNIALTGTVEHCAKRVKALQAIGVDEIVCLIDFLDDREAIMESLTYLSRLRAMFDPTTPAEEAGQRVSGRL